MSAVRQTLVKTARRIVVKVGSGVIASRKSGLFPERMHSVIRQIALARAAGREVILVSSGAVAAGLSALGIQTPHGIPVRQAAAAVGQSRLIRQYEELSHAEGFKVAQVLLTQDDIANRRRFLNARNTFAALLDLDIVPIVNENDSVVVEEIKFGDNDTLSSLVASLTGADLLLILSDVDGLYSADPRTDPTARRIEEVTEITPEIRAVAEGPKSREGTGGMITKVTAAERLAKIGIPTLILSGTEPDAMTQALAGQPVGTLFHPSASRQARKKYWLANVARPQGRLLIDAGAAQALVTGKKSLLPSGIKGVSGQFEMGAGVVCVGPDGREVARGLTNFSADEIEKILGCHTSRIEERLGYKSYDEVIHRDNLVITAA